MSQHGKFKKRLSLLDLTFLGLGSIIGSGWLFAAMHAASSAGPAAWVSWVIGAVAVLFLGLVYAELGGAIPVAGGTVRYPVYSHGPLIGYLMGFASLIAFSSVSGIEAEAARQYAASWWPMLTQPGAAGLPTVLGWFVQFALLCVFFLLNYWSVNAFGKANSIITTIKFVVPLITIVVLFTQFKGINFSVQGFAPFGFPGIESAVSTSGIIFAFLGFQQAVGFAGEAKNPQRNIPLAIFFAVALSAGLYMLLQIVFIGGIPTHLLSGGWGNIGNNFSLPFKDIAVVLGFGWLATVITVDAIISPSGTGNIYLSATSRVIFGWAQNRTFFKIFGRVDEKTGIPRPALWLAFLMAIFWTLPFPSWGKLVGVVSSATVLTYIVGPISAQAFRRNAADLHRPFFLKGLGFFGPVSFIIASLIIYWSGWQTDSWLIGSQLVMFILYVVFKNAVPTDQVSFAQQVKSTWWLVFYYIVLFILSLLGTFGGGLGILKDPWDQILVAVVSLVTYYWGGNTGLPKALLDDEELLESGSDNFA